MALATYGYQTYGAVGNKENYLDIITNISPDMNVLIKKFAQTSVQAKEVNWLTDDIRPAKINQQLEKAAYTTNEGNVRKQLSNQVQHFMEGVTVTDAQDKVAKYGIPDTELKYQMRNSTEAIARDLEFAVLQGQATAGPVSATTSVAPKMAGAQYFTSQVGEISGNLADTNELFTASAAHKLHKGELVVVTALGTPANTAAVVNKYYYVGGSDTHFTSTTFQLYTTAEAAMSANSDYIVANSGASTFKVNTCNSYTASGSLTEQMFNDAMEIIYQHGGNPDVAIVSPKNKRLISGWTAGVMKTADMATKELVQRIDIYESDFGRIEILPHRMQTNSRVDFLEWNRFKLATLIPFHVEDVPRSGTFRDQVIVGSATVICLAPSACGAITNLS